MYRKRETKIADAIRTDSSKDKLFSYIVLFVISLVVVVMGYVLGGLITSLSKHMESVVLNINSMSLSIKSMEKDMTKMTTYIETMDTSTQTISVGIQKMNKSMSEISVNVDNMEGKTKDIKDEMRKMNKMNPMKLF